MISLGIKNPPAAAKSWLPVIYEDYVPNYPDYSLDLDWTWEVAAFGFMDLRFIFYTNSPRTESGFVIVDSYDIDGAMLEDGKSYVFDYASKTFGERIEESSIGDKLPWIISGAAIVGLAAVAIVSGRRK